MDDVTRLRHAADRLRLRDDPLWLAVADWLDAEADFHWQLATVNRVLTAVGWKAMTCASTLPAALEVARVARGENDG